MALHDPFAAVEAAVAPGAKRDPILVAPPGASVLNWRHPQHGSPSATWAYRNAAGDVLGFDARFDFAGPDGPEKLIIPLSWSGTGWQAKAFANPRPLYGLDRLAERPDAPVVIAEGCKACDAAAALFPDAVAVSWSGGCNADHLADWSPLAGRDVLVWPDNDPPGVAVAARIGATLAGLGVASLAVLDLEGLGEVKGWDAADALAAGWTPQTAAAFATARSRLVELTARADGWGKPDMAVLALNRRKPPAFPPELFGPLWPLVTDVAAGAGAPVDYAAVGLLAVAAALVGGKRKAVPFATSDWTEPAILWAACVGEPSSNKSPALSALTAHVHDLEAEDARTFAEKLQHWEALRARAAAERETWEKAVKQAAKDGEPTPPKPYGANEPPRPPLPRKMVMDTTPEALWEALEGNPQGLLNFHDEIAGWLANFDRYNGDSRAFWLQAWNGGKFTVDRKGRGALGPLILPFAGLSVLGGIQPDKMASAMMGGDDDGMAARFLFAWPEKLPFRRPRTLADKARLEHLFKRLCDLQWGLNGFDEQVAIRLPLDPDASDLFEAWKKAADAREDEGGTLYKSWAGKTGALVLRVALVLTLIGWADGDAWDAPGSITSATIKLASNFVEAYARPMALRVFGDAALRPVDRNAATLARHIVKHRLATINARTIRRGPPKLPGLSDAAAMGDAIELLVDADWLRPTPGRDGGTAGRLSKDYAVNPAVLEGGGAG